MSETKVRGEGCLSVLSDGSVQVSSDSITWFQLDEGLCINNQAIAVFLFSRVVYEYTQKLEYISFTSYAILLIFNPECSVASHVFPFFFQGNPKGFIL